MPYERVMRPSASWPSGSPPLSKTSPSISASWNQAGIVGRTKQGTFVRYSITDDAVFALCDQVCGGLRQQIDELDQILTGGTR